MAVSDARPLAAHAQISWCFTPWLEFQKYRQPPLSDLRNFKNSHHNFEGKGSPMVVLVSRNFNPGASGSPRPDEKMKQAGHANGNTEHESPPSPSTPARSCICR